MLLDSSLIYKASIRPHKKILHRAPKCGPDGYPSEFALKDFCISSYMLDIAAANTAPSLWVTAHMFIGFIDGDMASPAKSIANKHFCLIDNNEPEQNVIIFCRSGVSHRCL